MRILIIPSWYPTTDDPISGVFFREQALALQKAGHRVGVLVAPSLRSKREVGRIRRRTELATTTLVEDDSGLATYRTSQWGWFPGFLPSGNLWLIVRAGLHAFERVLQEQGHPEIIHAHSILYGGYLAVQIRKRWHVPVVLTEHSTAFMRNLIRPDQQKIVRHTLQHSDRRLAVSEALASSLRQYSNGCSIEVLGNLVNTDFFAPGRTEPHSPNFVFATVAFLTPKKGIDLLLKAFALAFRGEPALLRIGGAGSEQEALEQQSRQLGLASQVEFLGQLSREQVRTLLQQSHALVSPSYVETFGISLIEAMACGKPVIATRSGGPESYVNAQNGLLVPPGDVPALAGALQQMVRDYQGYDPNQIREDCVARFGERAIVQRLEEIYRSLAPS